MTARNRARMIGMPGGTATWYDGTLSPQTSSYSLIETCNDIVGNYGGNNPFYLLRTSNLAWSLRGQTNVNGFGWKYNGYVRTSSPGAHLGPTTTAPTDNQAISEALAKTNPNRPHVDVPVFLAELRDVPRMMRYFSQIGYKMFRDRPITSVAEAYLTWEYGIKLFMEDLFRMMDFTNATEKRLRELRNLQTGRSGLGRNATIWKDEAVFAPWNTVATSLYQESNNVSAVWHTLREVWASTRWVPTVDISSLSDEDLRARANRIVFGLDLSFATLWEAMPWSWLIDWYTNIGDLMSLSRNTIPVSHEGSCVMRRTTTRLKSLVKTSGPGVLSATNVGVSATRLELMRTPVTFGPLPEFNLPFLNGKQLSILSAITVLKFGLGSAF